jgi:hypothetical protein
MERHGFRWPRPATLIAAVALFASIGAGSVYAAVRIDGRQIRARSLPGNRIKPHSIPPNRLAAAAAGAAGRVTGAQVDERSLSQVPSADFADSTAYATLARESEIARKATNAESAETAQYAVHAVDADTVNGHEAGCRQGSDLFAGACWATAAEEIPISAPDAADACAKEGGSLPEALQLAAYARRKGVTLSSGGEWSSDITNVSGLNAFAVVTVDPSGGVNFSASSQFKQYRCVFPVVS